MNTRRVLLRTFNGWKIVYDSTRRYNPFIVSSNWGGYERMQYADYFSAVQYVLDQTGNFEKLETIEHE